MSKISEGLASEGKFPKQYPYLTLEIKASEKARRAMFSCMPRIFETVISPDIIP